MGKEILVIKRETIFKEGDFQGFISSDEKDFTEIILNNFEYKERNQELENNPDYKQIIPYIVVINPKDKKVFGYKRFKLAQGIHETRLHNKFSFGLGGHIDKGDDESDIIHNSMMREFNEEVKMDNYPTPEVLGFINDDSNPVGSVHLGILALAKTENKIEKREDEEVKDEKFYSIEEIDSIMKNPEIEADSWTKLSWPFVKSYLQSI